MTLELPDTVLEALGAAIARHLQSPPDMEMLTLKKLSAESGMSVDVLRAGCLAYEAGNPDGLRCTRATEKARSTGAPVLVSRDWFLAWRERQADLNTKLSPVIGKAKAA
jgi:hypothetical protein